MAEKVSHFWIPAMINKYQGRQNIFSKNGWFSQKTVVDFEYATHFSYKLQKQHLSEKKKKKNIIIMWSPCLTSKLGLRICSLSLNIANTAG